MIRHDPVRPRVTLFYRALKATLYNFESYQELVKQEPTQAGDGARLAPAAFSRATTARRLSWRTCCAQ